MIVYIAKNKNNGKVYIGKTIRTLSHAKARHHQRAKFIWKYGVYSRFYTALRKYGFEAFEWRIAYEGVSDEDIQAHERLFISQYSSMDKSFGYNMTPGGDGGAGKTLSAAHVEKLSKMFCGANNPQYGKFGSDHPAFGNRHTDETKQKISEAHKGRVVSYETRAKLSSTRKYMFAEQVAVRRTRLNAEREEKRIEHLRRKEAGEWKGENAGASKLTDEERANMCLRRHSGESYASIALDFSVGLTGVRAVCHTWGPANGFPFKKIIVTRKQRLSDSKKKAICEKYSKNESRITSLAVEYEVGETTIHTVLRVWGPINGFPELGVKSRKTA